MTSKVIHIKPRRTAAPKKRRSKQTRYTRIAVTTLAIAGVLFGVGAVIGALNVSNLSSRLGAESAIRLSAVAMGAGIAVVAASQSKIVSGIALLVAGAGWTASVTLFNVGIQLVAPRWVSGRALAAFQASISARRRLT